LKRYPRPCGTGLALKEQEQGIDSNLDESQ
jgi:hypothetical protein